MTQDLTAKITISPTIEDAKEQILNELFLWFKDVQSRHSNTPWIGIHDEGTYLLSFREFIKLTFDESKRQEIINFLMERLQACDLYFDKHLKDGYWSRQEAHHGIEHFCIFLNWMHELMPHHPIVKKQILNASRHLIEKLHKKEPWYDKESKRFVSIFLGSKRNGREYFNAVEHLRFIRLAWMGFWYDNNSDLYKILIEYSNEWKQAILSNSIIPTYLEYKNISYQDLSERYRLLYRSVVGAAPQDATMEANAEIHIANGTIPLFFHIYSLTQDQGYLEASRRILNALKPQLQSKYAHPLGSLFFKMFSLGYFPELKDLEIHLGIKEYIPLINESTMIINQNVNWKDPKYYNLKNTVGMRRDMPEIIINAKNGKQIALPSPGTLSLLYKITHNHEYCIIALDYARTILKIVRNIYDDGRKHGCGSQTISAFCIGHGRNWSSGYVSTALRSLLPDEIDGLPFLKLDFNKP
jgi:hypothetical protein